MKNLLTKILSRLLILSGLFLLSWVSLQMYVSRKVRAYSTDYVYVSPNTLPTLKYSDMTNLPKGKIFVINLNTNRVVKLIGEINSDLAVNVIKNLSRLNSESSRPITLLINSPGGSVLEGAQIISAIEASPSRIDTVCVLECASMAALIHQYGSNRYVFSHSILMFHPAFGTTVGDIDRMSSELNMIKRYIYRMELNAATRSHISIDEYKYRSGTQIWLEGIDAVTEHFSDGVVYFKGNTMNSVYDEIESFKKDNATNSFKNFLHDSLLYMFRSANKYFNSNNQLTNYRD